MIYGQEKRGFWPLISSARVAAFVLPVPLNHCAIASKVTRRLARNRISELVSSGHRWPQYFPAITPVTNSSPVDRLWRIVDAGKLLMTGRDGLRRLPFNLSDSAGTDSIH